MFIDDYLSKSQIGTLIVTGIGAAIFFPSYFGVRHTVHRNTCDRINNECGTGLSYKACAQFKSEFINGIPNVNTNTVISAVRGVANLFLDPLPTIKNSLRNILSFLKALRDFSGTAYAFGIGHEVGLFLGSTATEFDMAFLAEDAGFHFWGSVGVFVPCGQVLTIIWRVKYYNMIGEQMRYFHDPSPEVCEKVREFETQLQRELHQNVVTEPTSAPTPQYYYDYTEEETDAEYEFDTRPLAGLGILSICAYFINRARSMSARTGWTTAGVSVFFTFVMPSVAEARPSEDECEEWIDPRLKGYCSKPGSFMSRGEILPDARDELMPWEKWIWDYRAD